MRKYSSQNLGLARGRQRRTSFLLPIGLVSMVILTAAILNRAGDSRLLRQRCFDILLPPPSATVDYYAPAKDTTFTFGPHESVAPGRARRLFTTIDSLHARNVCVAIALSRSCPYQTLITLYDYASERDLTLYWNKAGRFAVGKQWKEEDLFAFYLDPKANELKLGHQPSSTSQFDFTARYGYVVESCRQSPGFIVVLLAWVFLFTRAVVKSLRGGLTSVCT